MDCNVHGDTRLSYNPSASLTIGLGTGWQVDAYSLFTQLLRRRILFGNTTTIPTYTYTLLDMRICQPRLPYGWWLARRHDTRGR